MSAPAKKSVSIISGVDEAGPRVASCLVRLRHRWDTFGTAATEVGCSSDTDDEEVEVDSVDVDGCSNVEASAEGER